MSVVSTIVSLVAARTQGLYARCNSHCLCEKEAARAWDRGGDPVTSPPFWNAVIISPRVAMTVQVWGTGDVYEENKSQIVTTKNN